MHLAVDARMAGDSGIGTYIRELVPRVAALRADWRVTLLVREPQSRVRDWAVAPNIALIECQSAIYTPGEQLELWRKCPAGVDLFWSPHYNIPLARRGPLLVTVHDVFHLAMPTFVSGSHRRVYARAMFNAVRRRASAIICDSEFTRSELLRLVPGEGSNPIVIHAGVGAQWFDPPTATVSRPRPYLIAVGNVKPHKNLGRLIQAFVEIHDQIPHDLVIVGRREGMRTVDTDAEGAARALGARVVFTGEIPFEELRGLVSEADALVYPSLYEGFGLPPLEAMAAGCPCIVSSAASLPEVCGDAALYCDPYSSHDIAERIVQLLGDEPLRQDLRARGRARARSFPWSNCATSTVEVIENVVGEASARRAASASPVAVVTRFATPHVSVLLLNWNGWRDTLECLESLFRLDYPSFTVVICDNASSDGSLDAIRRWAQGGLEPGAAAESGVRHLSWPPVPKPISVVAYTREEAEHGGDARESGARIVLIQTGANLGFAGGNNVGLRYLVARGSLGYVWLLNNDIVVAPDALRLLVATAEGDRQVGCVGATLLEYKDPEVVQSAGGGRMARWQGMPLTTPATGQRRGTPSARPGRLDFINGGCMLVAVETVAQIGLIDERYFLYCEDIDYSLRIVRRGLQLAYCAEAEVWHKGGSAIGHGSLTHDYYLVRNPLLLVRKFNPALILPAIGFSIYQCVLPKLLRREWKRLGAVGRGYRDFVRTPKDRSDAGSLPANSSASAS